MTVPRPSLVVVLLIRTKVNRVGGKATQVTVTKGRNYIEPFYGINFPHGMISIHRVCVPVTAPAADDDYVSCFVGIELCQLAWAVKRIAWVNIGQGFIIIL